MSAPRQYRWYVYTDDKANQILANHLAQDVIISTYEGRECSDGKKRNLWEVSSDNLDLISQITKRLKLSILVFRQVGEGPVVRFRPETPKVEVLVSPLTRPSQEWPDTDNGEPPPF